MMNGVKRLLQRELQIIRVPRDTDMFRGPIITPLTSAYQRYIGAILCVEGGAFLYWLLGLIAIVSSINVAGAKTVDFVNDNGYGTDVTIYNQASLSDNFFMSEVDDSLLIALMGEDGSLFDNNNNTDLLLLSLYNIDGSSKCPDIDVSDNLLVYFFKSSAPVAESMGKYSDYIVKLMQMGLLYHLGSGNANGVIFSLGFFMQPSFVPVVEAGPVSCTGCLSAACGACGAGLAFANLYCFALGPFAIPCLVAVGLGSCATPAVACTIVCIAPIP